MLPLDVLLRLSVIQAELRAIAEGLSPSAARVVKYSARVLDILRTFAGNERAA